MQINTTRGGKNGILPDMLMNDLLTLSRLQFGVTSVYHFLFVPLTLGLSLLVALMETMYVKTGNETYKRMTKFWGKLFLINFAVGVVTGIVQEFHFGMSWSGFSRFIGDIIGAPLAIEALAAFFMESTFLGIWIFGWDKISKKLHLLCIWIVVIAGMLSAFWILVVNTFMQEPAGFIIKNGKAELTDFFALIFNQHLWLQFPHVVMSGLVTGSVFVLSISAYHILKKNHTELFIKSVKIALTTGLISLVLVIFFGDAHGKYLFDAQPMKMAAAEGLWETEESAPLSLFAAADEKNHKNIFDIAIPKMLSFMAYSDFNAKVEGMNDLQEKYEKEYGPGNYIPPVNISYISFRLMVGSGMLMLLTVMVSIFLFWRKKLEGARWFLRLMVLIIPLPYIANTCGWLLTEMGRQPWVVSGVLKASDAVSKTVSVSSAAISLTVFLCLYAILAVIDVFLIAKFARMGPEESSIEKMDKTQGEGASLWI